MSLWELREKETGSVHSINTELSPETILRLREIGLDKGGSVTCLKQTPFGGPKLFQISDSVFSLERPVAESILINKGQQ